MTNVYCGADAAIITNDSFSFIFLRYRDDCIVSILDHATYGKIGIVCGYGIRFDAHSEYCIRDPRSGETFYSKLEYLDELEAHKKDILSLNCREATYTDWNGRVFSLCLAETMIDHAVISDEECDKLSTAEKMRIWNCGKRLVLDSFDDECCFEGEIITDKYAALFLIHTSDKSVYCRLGVHGYCEKGYAMRSTICIRHNECRMAKDHLCALEEFRPDEKYFTEGSCAFPPDGSWYWSVKDSDNHVVYLNGCGGDTYIIKRQ